MVQAHQTDCMMCSQQKKQVSRPLNRNERPEPIEPCAFRLIYQCYRSIRQTILSSPNSSRITRLLPVAWWRMFAVSLSSTKNVDCPARIRSEAPTLVKILSNGVRCASSAGTKQPTCLLKSSQGAEGFAVASKECGDLTAYRLMPQRKFNNHDTSERIPLYSPAQGWRRDTFAGEG